MTDNKFWQKFVQKLLTINPESVISSEFEVCKGDILIGTIEDEWAKRLWGLVPKLKLELEEYIKSAPEKIAETELLIRVSKGFFWELLYATFPNADDLSDKLEIVLCENWIIVASKYDVKRPSKGSRMFKNDN